MLSLSSVYNVTIHQYEFTCTTPYPTHPSYFKRLYLRPFHVNHGGHPALGYTLLSKTPGKLKPQYQNLPSSDIRTLIQSGISIKEEDSIQVEVTYTGDTCAAGIKNRIPWKKKGEGEEEDLQQQEERSDLYLQQAFTAPLLFCELTFLDVHTTTTSNLLHDTETTTTTQKKKTNKKQKKPPTILDQTFAKTRGHMHIQDVVPVFSSHGWDVLENEEEETSSGKEATSKVLPSSDTTTPMHFSNSNNNSKKIVFFHLSGRHAPATRALNQIVTCGLIPPKLLKYCFVAISSFITTEEEDDDDYGQTTKSSEDNDSSSWLSLVGKDGCISLFEYAKYLERL